MFVVIEWVCDICEDDGIEKIIGPFMTKDAADAYREQMGKGHLTTVELTAP